MKILFTGRPNKGSWKIRGLQIATADPAWACVPEDDVSRETLRGVEAAVIVKRFNGKLLATLEKWGGPVLYDVIDPWPKPSEVSEAAEAVAYARSLIPRGPRIAGVLVANHRMQADFAEAGQPAFIVHHHARPDQPLNPVRDKVQVVGYEGNPRWLGQWREVLEHECEARGWAFAVSPYQLADLDIVVAMRGAPFNGYLDLNWKSNVKLANAQATGTPVIAWPEASYVETAAAGPFWAKTRAQLRSALDRLTDRDQRAMASRNLLLAAPSVSLAAIAKQYRVAVSSLLEGAVP